MGVSPPRSPARPHSKGFASVTGGPRGPKEDGPLAEATKAEPPPSWHLGSAPVGIVLLPRGSVDPGEHSRGGAGEAGPAARGRTAQRGTRLGQRGLLRARAHCRGRAFYPECESHPQADPSASSTRPRCPPACPPTPGEPLTNTTPFWPSDNFGGRAEYACLSLSREARSGNGGKTRS